MITLLVLAALELEEQPYPAQSHEQCPIHLPRCHQLATKVQRVRHGQERPKGKVLRSLLGLADLKRFGEDSCIGS